MRSGKSGNTIALASHSIVKERWILLSRIYRKKVALSMFGTNYLVCLSLSNTFLALSKVISILSVALNPSANG